METWKDIIDYEGKWQVSDYGNVRSIDHEVSFGHNKRIVKGRTLKYNKHRSGYLLVGVGKKRTVHRLVANAFIPNPFNLPQINHKDGNKTNNSVSNLEWCTCEWNNRHQIALVGRKRKHKHNKLTEIQAIEIANSIEPKMEICRIYNISRHTVYLIQKSYSVNN